MIHAALIAIAAASQGPVHLRGEPAPDPRPVVEVTIEGVKVAGDAPETIGWERVRELTGDDAGAAAGFDWLINDAWRALARVRRGDLELAGPALERMDETLRGVRSTTSLLAAAGMAALRVSEGRSVDALDPALRVRALQRAGARLDNGLLVKLGYDPETGLWPLLPPIQIGSEPIASWAGLPERVGITLPDESTEALAAWYARAAELASQAGGGGGEAGEDPPLASDDGASVALVAAMVRAAVHPDTRARAEGRVALDSMLTEGGGGWREAWIRLALGRSLSRESDEASRRRGLVESLTAAALVAATHPSLASAALIDAARAAEGLGMRAEAAALRARASVGREAVTP